MAGCQTLNRPATVDIAGPTAALPQPAVAAPPPTNGAIFQAASYRLLFEDHRARLVGDTITVQMVAISYSPLIGPKRTVMATRLTVSPLRRCRGRWASWAERFRSPRSATGTLQRVYRRCSARPSPPPQGRQVYASLATSFCSATGASGPGKAERESGLLYGTPLAVGPARGDGGPEEVLFQAVLRTFCGMALDIAEVAEAAPGPRPEQLLLLFTALSNQLEDAADVHRRIEKAWKQWPLPPKLWLKVEQALEARALSLAADPYYGLVLHNGAVYVDANVFGRLALAYFTRSSFPLEDARRRLQFAAQQKARLVEVLVGLVCAERKPGFPTRRAILRQIDDLQLPPELADRTREFARRAFEKPPSMKRLTQGVRSRGLKRFILEQTVLASIVEGRRSPREVEWKNELGAALGFTREAVMHVELEMAAFYQTHRDVVDVFTLADGAEVLGEEWVESLATTVRKNSRAVMNEVRKTGELSVLLARAARGQVLTRDEKARMREQLIDVARAVPALAVFAAPGGLVLLLALAKVLPFDLLPSSFRDDPEDEPESTGS